MTAFRIRLVAVVVIGVLGGALAGLALGLWPGDDPYATVDRCYITYDRQENMHSRCVGNWTRGGRGHRGPINGIAVSESWKPKSLEADPNHEWEVEIPPSYRQLRVFADDRQAWAPSVGSVRWSFVPAAAGALLVGTAWAVTSAILARSPDRHLRPRRSRPTGRPHRS
ncbi:hypothetical protein [Polymorphospora rubra]|uniref:hypothetical protein n=1 Tax=Polymorphospora rubra TaxID=338584 RepID=UPI0033D8FE70